MRTAGWQGLTYRQTQHPSEPLGTRQKEATTLLWDQRLPLTHNKTKRLTPSVNTQHISKQTSRCAGLWLSFCSHKVDSHLCITNACHTTVTNLNWDSSHSSRMKSGSKKCNREDMGGKGKRGKKESQTTCGKAKLMETSQSGRLAHCGCLWERQTSNKTIH